MIIQKRLNKLEELYRDKIQCEGYHLVLAFVENDPDKMEVFTASDGAGSKCLFSGDIPGGRDYLKTITYQHLVEIPGPQEWAK